MKKLPYSIVLFSLSLILLFSCEEVDKTPPTISISSHYSGQIVGEIVLIIVNTKDNDGIKKVEVFINDELVSTQNKSPYEYIWNTTDVEDGEYIIKAIAYDNSGNYTESQQIMLKVDNQSFSPHQINVLQVTYILTEMRVTWEKSNEEDFELYRLYYATDENGEKTEIDTFQNINTTKYVTYTFNPGQENWYWVEVEDTLGLRTIGNGNKNYVDDNPTPSQISYIAYKNNSFPIEWSGNDDWDFSYYELFESNSADMSNKSSIFRSNDVSITNYIVNNVNEDERRYYELVTTDIWGLNTSSKIKVGSSYDKIVYKNSIHIIGEDKNNAQTIVQTNIKMFDVSPNGDEIALVNENWKLWTVGLDGIGYNKLSDENLFGEDLKYSPTGKYITYYSFSGAEREGDIYIFNTDNKTLSNVTLNRGGACVKPSISPDESKIVYAANDANVFELPEHLEIMNINGSNPIRLPIKVDWGSTINFSKDGNKILYVNGGGLYTIDINSYNVINLVAPYGNNIHRVEYSSDGERIVFGDINNSTPQSIYVVNSDGSNLVNLTNQTILNSLPHFNSTGTKIVFTAESDGSQGIFIMDTDGSNTSRLTSDMGQYPKFVPR